MFTMQSILAHHQIFGASKCFQTRHVSRVYTSPIARPVIKKIVPSLWLKEHVRNVNANSGLDLQTLTLEAYLIGKSIIIFTMFYCTLNWAMYRSLREKQEKADKKSDKHDDGKHRK